jgi:hypothetical protein
MAMHKIKNLTNSPFDLQATTGKVLLPAFGEVEAEFATDYLAMLRKARTVDVIPHPLDHDGDGVRGGAKAPPPAKAEAPAKKPAAKKPRTKRKA